ncbi:MAG: HupE/UreJ family protein [Saprospiraceae bacterium]
MESAFLFFLQQGYEHILDLNGIDHLLFIVALCASYRLAEWKKVAILVTAFTIGHSVTLAMAALKIITFPSMVIEWLVPITILLTAIYNLLTATDEQYEEDSFYLNTTVKYKYSIALFFGLIHGMAFSNFFKSTQMPGQESELIQQLFAFNIGVEIGQLIIVIIVLLIGFVAMNVLKIKQLLWSRSISIAIIIATFYLFYNLFTAV